jgi:hypothetical protein
MKDSLYGARFGNADTWKLLDALTFGLIMKSVLICRLAGSDPDTSNQPTRTSVLPHHGCNLNPRCPPRRKQRTRRLFAKAWITCTAPASSAERARLRNAAGSEAWIYPLTMTVD